MANASAQLGIHRIVVILDAVEFGQSTLQTSVRLAAALGAKIEGVFVRDSNLSRLTGLPFLRELRPWSLAEDVFSEQRIESELRALARNAEQFLAQAAAALGVDWSFQVWQGRIEAEVLISHFEADLVTIHRSCFMRSYRLPPLPLAYRGATRQAKATIDVLFDDSSQSARALAIACQLGREWNTTVRLWLTAADDETMTRLQTQANTLLAAYQQPVRCISLLNVGVRAFCQALNRSASSMLIAESGHPLLRQQGLSQCLKELSCPVLLLR